MISGISAAATGMQNALARFDRATAAITGSSWSSSTGSPAATDCTDPSTLDLTGVEIEMMNAKFAFSASLVALRASTDLLADAIDIGGYGVSANDRR